MKEEFRVGCWDGEWKDETVKIKHDSMDDWVEVDWEEAHDLDDLVALLLLRSKAEYGDSEDVERLETLVNNLEA